MPRARAIRAPQAATSPTPAVPVALPPGPYVEAGAEPLRLTEAGLTVVEAVAREGGKQRAVAAALGVTFKQFRSLIDRDEATRLRWEKGVAELESEVAGLLLKAARAGSVVPAIFFSKAVLGWRETDQPNAAQANIIITPVSLPAPLSEEQYRLKHQPAPVIDVEATEVTTEQKETDQ